MSFSAKKFTPQKPVDWYDPRQLAKTGLQTVISSIFGNFNDKRETQGLMDPEGKPYDYSEGKEELWFDYISDTGDGFDSTFSMAKLLTSKDIEVDGKRLPRGELLIMGGDQVYPVASRDEYDNRLIGPYATAFPKDETDAKAPHIFAIPGNHDWYDGLTNFLKVFCQKRNIGNWRSQQRRSYFALKLPHKVWVFGVDVQLNSDIDYNQVQYFKGLLQNEVAPDSHIILCTAEPSWVFATAKKNASFRNLRYLEKLIAGKVEIPNESPLPKQHQVLTLSGDLHHYSRYSSETHGQYITSGGGGAFLHPTHTLPDNISLESGASLKQEKVWPEKDTSKKLLAGNLLFPFTSWKMTALFGVIHLIVGWMLYLKTKVELDGFGEALFHSPTSMLYLGLVLFGIIAFTDTRPYGNKVKGPWFYKCFGGIHAVLQAGLILLTAWATLDLCPLLRGEHVWWEVVLSGLVLLIGGGLLSSFVFGVYLALSNLILGNHNTEAFSSLRIKGYKNFLRIHLSKKGIRIYPIGVKNVPDYDHGASGEALRNEVLPVCELIEEVGVIGLR